MAEARTPEAPVPVAAGGGPAHDAALVEQLERMLEVSRAQQRHLRTSILRVLDYLEHPSTR